MSDTPLFTSCCNTDALAASFLNYQVDAFENPTYSIPSAPMNNMNNGAAFMDNGNSNDIFADFSSFINAPLASYDNSNTSVPQSTSPPLQNAFRTFSGNYDNTATFVPSATTINSGGGNLYRKSSSSSSSSASSSPLIASPAFDAAPAFNFAGNAGAGFATKYGGMNGFNSLPGGDFNSPNLSGVDTPALVADDGNDLVGSLTTSPMWGQLDLAGISLFPQQQIQAQAAAAAVTANAQATAPTMSPALAAHRASFSAVQQASLLPTISPRELSMSLGDKSPQIITGASLAVSSPLVQAISAPTSTTPAFSTKPALKNSGNGIKRSRQSPAFGGDDSDEESDEEGENEANNARSGKKARRSTSVHFTGSRNGVTPLLSLDAPTQSRTYRGPESKTSKRAIPAAAARKVAAIKAQAEMQKRARRSVSVVDSIIAPTANSNAGGNDDEEEDEEVHEAIEMSIEAKRRQNTIAARRSRQRKAEHLSGLEDSIRALTERVAQLENEKTVWMMRALSAGWTEDSRAA